MCFLFLLDDDEYKNKVALRNQRINDSRPPDINEDELGNST